MMTYGMGSVDAFLRKIADEGGPSGIDDKMARNGGVAITTWFFFFFLFYSKCLRKRQR